MQSQLQAALLGQPSNINQSSTVEDEDNHFQEEEAEEAEDFDEETEGDNGPKSGVKTNTGGSSRTVTLQMLLDADILQPGKGTMSIEYLGQRFVGDLLEDGKIQSQETDIIFASPSAWAIACKRFINPDKKSGCGWASVKYRGRKLDAYKNIWYRKKKEEQDQENFEHDFNELKNMANTMSYSRVVVKHNTIANRTLTHDANTLIECVPFSNLGKIQPFLVTLSTNAALVMDFHCHLTKSEVSGYLAGHWDLNTQNLQVTHAFPCCNTKSDRDKASEVEMQISRTISKEKLTLVGWYHSHPFTAAAPTLRDIDAQLDYQIKMKGLSDNSYTPCIGVILSPYNYENASLESSIISYWVIPPPEAKPNEYGRPMLMSYSVNQDPKLTPHVTDSLKKCYEYYKKEKDFVNFSERYTGSSLYVDKLKSTLISKFPRDENETTVWSFIKENVGYSAEEPDGLLSIPNISKTHLLPTLNTPVSLGSNLILPPDISSLFYNTSGKFPSASSILGLPDPMAHSTLAANNMFLQTNLFKMQELLKPLSSSSPIPKSKESKPSVSPLKIPMDLKYPKCDYTSVPQVPTFLKQAESNLSKSSIVDFSYKSKELSSDLSQTISDYSLDLSKSIESGEKPNKIPKIGNFSMLDLSVSKMQSMENPSSDISLDLSKPQNLSADNNDVPLKLTQ